MEELQEDIGFLDENMLLTADNGYYSGENLEYIENQPWDGLIPNKAQASQAKGKEIGKYAKHNFQYDHINDSYQCPNGNILSHHSTSSKGVKLYYSNNCHTCLDKDNCCETNVRIHFSI
ncbi:MAG: Pseudogene of conserved hypothetical protein [Methanobrevibacter sp. CfCl-M3]